MAVITNQTGENVSMRPGKLTTIDVSAADSAVFPGGVQLYVGSTGDVAVKDMKGTSVIFTNVPDATILPFLVKQILKTGTTASEILAAE